jgi:hypothetical protein
MDKEQRKIEDKVAIISVGLGTAVMIGTAYAYYLGKQFNKPTIASDESAHLPADGEEDGDESSTPAEDE